MRNRDGPNIAFGCPSGLQRKAMKVQPSRLAKHRGTKRPWVRYLALVFAAGLIGGCSAQPMTVQQELTTTAIAGVIGAGSGALFAAGAGKSYPASIAIGA